MIQKLLTAFICCLLSACGGSDHEYAEYYNQQNVQCETSSPAIKCVCDGANCTFTSNNRDSKVL